jgi:hypothetical protein
MTAINAHEVAALVENAGMPVDIDGDLMRIGISPVDDGWLVTAGPIVDGCFDQSTMFVSTGPEDALVQAEDAQAWNEKFVADRLVWQAQQMLEVPDDFLIINNPLNNPVE